MINYAKVKNKLDQIRDKYGCKGDIIFRAAIRLLVDAGRSAILYQTYRTEMDDIDAKHDKADEEGKALFMTRDFEKTIYECAKDLCGVNTYGILQYIQREIWLGGEVGEPDYQRAIQIIRNFIFYTVDGYGSCNLDCEEKLDKLREMELTDEEIEYFGWKFLFEEGEE